MRVKLIAWTPNALQVLSAAAHTCYSEGCPDDIWRDHHTDGRTTPEKVVGRVSGIIARNHNSVLRHVNYTFAISSISRACANQLTRHGPGWAFDQQSLRYVSLRHEPDWVVPFAALALEGDTLRAGYRASWEAYIAAIGRGVKAEDARSLLPLATPTNLVATANLAALMHFFRVRGLHETGKAQDEIVTLAHRMVSQVLDREPWLEALWFQHVGKVTRWG
jgi:thymidylate synthase (FAD)